jgi:hypothetical protein
MIRADRGSQYPGIYITTWYDSVNSLYKSSFSLGNPTNQVLTSLGHCLSEEPQAPHSQSPFEDLNGFRYLDHWLLNLLIASLMVGILVSLFYTNLWGTIALCARMQYGYFLEGVRSTPSKK